MPREEGVIKFKLHWQNGEVPAFDLQGFNQARSALIQAGLIGEADGVGFGNLSVRLGSGFLISGTQTGHLKELSSSHIVLVRQFNIKGNEIWSTGQTKPSSESMTHGAVYSANSEIGAVVHGHHLQLWEYGLKHWKSTPESIPYGTSDMANAVIRLVEQVDCISGLLAMAGHPGGVLAWGGSLESATGLLLKEIQLMG